MMIQLLKLYLEAWIYWCKNDEYTPKNDSFFFLQKNDENILWGGDFIDKNLWKHTKIQFLMSPFRHTDCLNKFFEAVIYGYKKQ